MAASAFSMAWAVSSTSSQHFRQVPFCASQPGRRWGFQMGELVNPLIASETQSQAGLESGPRVLCGHATLGVSLSQVLTLSCLAH